jgi:hypothetical protein
MSGLQAHATPVPELQNSGSIHAFVGMVDRPRRGGMTASPVILSEAKDLMPVASGVEVPSATLRAGLRFNAGAIPARDDKSEGWCIAAVDRLHAVAVMPSAFALQNFHIKQYPAIEAPACLAGALGGP